MQFRTPIKFRQSRDSLNIQFIQFNAIKLDDILENFPSGRENNNNKPKSNWLIRPSLASKRVCKLFGLVPNLELFNVQQVQANKMFYWIGMCSDWHQISSHVFPAYLSFICRPKVGHMLVKSRCVIVFNWKRSIWKKLINNKKHFRVVKATYICDF